MLLKHSLAAVHAVPTAFLGDTVWHTPKPSHTLLEPQLGLSSTPDGMLVHVPRWPSSPHERHSPTQLVMQHTPSTQIPFAQSLDIVQIFPGPHAPQRPPQSTSIS